MSASVHKLLITRVPLTRDWLLAEDTEGVRDSAHHSFSVAFKELYTRVHARGWKPQAACSAPNGGMVVWAEE